MSSGLFPTSIYGRGDASFTPLFRMLEDFDSYSRSGNGTGNGTGNGSGRNQLQRGANLPTFHPRFDVRETATRYELHGELPGLEKKDIHIEFADAQTMIVRGRVERHYSSAGSQPNAGLLDDNNNNKSADNSNKGHAATGEQQQHHHHPTVTVEDEDEEAARTKQTGTEVVHHKSGDAAAKHHNNQRHDTAKYWVSERSIGEFSRTFHFQSLVDQDAVKASLNNGVLSVEVPKARKLEGRRITVD